MAEQRLGQPEPVPRLASERAPAQAPMALAAPTPVPMERTGKPLRRRQARLADWAHAQAREALPAAPELAPVHRTRSRSPARRAAGRTFAPRL